MCGRHHRFPLVRDTGDVGNGSHFQDVALVAHWNGSELPEVGVKVVDPRLGQARVGGKGRAEYRVPSGFGGETAGKAYRCLQRVEPQGGDVGLCPDDSASS